MSLIKSIWNFLILSWRWLFILSCNKTNLSKIPSKAVWTFYPQTWKIYLEIRVFKSQVKGTIQKLHQLVFYWVGLNEHRNSFFCSIEYDFFLVDKRILIQNQIPPLKLLSIDYPISLLAANDFLQVATKLRVGNSKVLLTIFAP